MSTISEAWFFRMKAATRDLFARCGTLARCAEITSLSDSQLSRWQSIGSPEIISIPAAMLLEADCGAPLVTAVMADLHGRRLSDAEASGAAASCLFRDYGALARQFGEVAASMADALADGTVTPTEAERVDRFARELDVGLDRLRQSLAGVRAAGGTGPAGAGLRVVPAS